MKINVPPTLRFALYVATVLGTPLVAYLRARGIIGDLEVTLWGAEVAAVTAMAAFNVPSPSVELPPAVLLDAPAPMSAEPLDPTVPATDATSATEPPAPPAA